MKKKQLQVLLTLALSFLLNGCPKPPNLLLVHLFDVSESASNEAFVKDTQQVCHGTVETARSHDRISRIAVSAEIQAADPQPIREREKLHRACKERSLPKGTGTFTCPAWELAMQLSDRYPNYRPVVINQIHTNEYETFCKETLEQLVQKISERQGRLVIVGSTNDGNQPFNAKLWSTLKSLPNNQFCSDSARACVISAIRSVRTQ